MLRSGEALVTTMSATNDDLIGTLRVRRDIKSTQSTSVGPNVVKLRDALDVIVAWCDSNPHELVLYDSLTIDSDVFFIFRRRCRSQ